MPTESNFKKIYDLNKAKIDFISELSRPILNFSGASTFTYHRIDSTGKAVSFCSDPKILRCYLQHVEEKGLFFQQHLKEIPKNNFYYFLWPNEVQNDLLSIMCKLNVWNGFNLYLKSDEYIENFVFTTHPNNTQVQNHCINNLSTMNSFAIFFKEKIHSLFQEITTRDMAFFNNSVDWQGSEKFPKYLPHFPLKSLTLQTGSGKVGISLREAQCLALINSGHTMKQIAFKLSISPRTVESYINNLKTKLGVGYKSELIQIFQSTENIFLRNYKSLLQVK